MNARNDDPFLAIDRAHELAGEQQDDFDAALARETKQQVAAMRSNGAAGHWQTLEGLAESLSHRLGQCGKFELLIRAALSCGAANAGQLLLDMINSCIADDAETAALKELERVEQGAVGRVRRDVAAAYGGFGDQA